MLEGYEVKGALSNDGGNVNWCSHRRGSLKTKSRISLQSRNSISGYLSEKKKNEHWGVPFVAQWLANPTRNHEVEGSIPGLAQWVKVPTLQ